MAQPLNGNLLDEKVVINGGITGQNHWLIRKTDISVSSVA